LGVGKGVAEMVVAQRGGENRGRGGGDGIEESLKGGAERGGEREGG